MGLRRVLSVLRSGLPRRAPLSTAPATREQPAAGPEAERGLGAAEAARPPVPAVDFGNTQEAYRSRRSWELVRSLLVLRLCASPALLARHEQVRGGRGGVQEGRADRAPRAFLPVLGASMKFRSGKQGRWSIACSREVRKGGVSCIPSQALKFYCVSY